MSELVKQLRDLASPEAECLSDGDRLNFFCDAGHQAADRIEALEAALLEIITDATSLNHALTIAREGLE